MQKQTFHSHFSGPDDCEFDFDVMCHWKNDPNNPSVFNWERNTGRTLSSSTGPSGDHTSGSGNQSPNPRSKSGRVRLDELNNNNNQRAGMHTFCLGKCSKSNIYSSTAFAGYHFGHEKLCCLQIKCLPAEIFSFCRC